MDSNYILVGLIAAFATLIFADILNAHKRRKLKRILEEEARRTAYQEIYENERASMLQSITIEMRELQAQRDSLLRSLDTEITRVKAERLHAVDALAEERKRSREVEYAQWDAQKKNEIDARLQKSEEEYSIKIAQLTAELQKLQAARDQLQAEVDIINAENHKHELEQNEIDMHRIILSDAAKDDLKFLDSITHKLHNPEILYKLMWTEYIQKPFQQMVKNIFGTDIPKNVIYCIENLENHKKYIGKTKQEISKRWSDHVKNSLLDRSKSNLYKALYGNWDKFIFTILEEVSDPDKLGERENYYINFFQTKNYGYNMTNGG